MKMRPVRYLVGLCGKGLKAYWRWVVETSEQLEHFQPW
jgi:hypothetical protein